MHFKDYIKSIKSKEASLLSYFLLAILRVVLIFVPQFGYIHPDEFFQSLEVVAGDHFELETTRTWEFNSSFPVRSLAVPYLCIKFPLTVLQFITLYTKHFLGIDFRSSYVLLVYPRLIMTILSFSNDYSMYKICVLYCLNYKMRLLALASSHVIMVFGTRTFSNTIEMALVSWLLYIVADTMVQSNTVIYQTEFLREKYKAAANTVERVKIYKLQHSLPSHSLNKCVLVACLCVIGVFNRPTFLIFGMPIVFFWLLRGMGTKTISIADFNIRMAALAICAIPALLFLTLVDSLYYGYLTPAEIERMSVTIDNFVFTPLNFVKYNIDPRETGKHGVHPWYTHLLLSIPLLFNILGIVAVFSFATMVYRFCRQDFRRLPRAQSIVALMTATIFVPLIVFSLINHQEPRFLLPLTLPIIFLYGPILEKGLAKIAYNRRISGQCLRKIWYSVNIFLLFFFGFLHQGGVYQLAEHFSHVTAIKANDVHVHLVTSHIYNVPQSFLLLPSTKKLHVNPDNGQRYQLGKQFHLHEYGTTDMDVLYRKLKLMLDVCEMRVYSKQQRYQLYLAIPSSLMENLNLAFYRSNNTLMRHTQLKVFYPHLSTEAMPQLFVKHPWEINTDVDDIDRTCSVYDNDNLESSWLSINSLLRQFSSFVHQFGLVLYQIDVRKNLN